MITIKPFQGLKRSVSCWHSGAKQVMITIKPFQGLKRAALVAKGTDIPCDDHYQTLSGIETQRSIRASMVRWCDDHYQTLSGIETWEPIEDEEHTEVMITIKPFQGLKRSTFGY